MLRITFDQMNLIKGDTPQKRDLTLTLMPIVSVS